MSTITKNLNNESYITSFEQEKKKEKEEKGKKKKEKKKKPW